jgi:hypothetical protein
MEAAMARYDQDRQYVERHMPKGTRHVSMDGKDCWIFIKNTRIGISITLALYYDRDENGYCAQVLEPALPESLKSIHAGHLFSDGVICMGEDSMRTRRTLGEAYGRSCLWAEGIACVLAGHMVGELTEFPFSINNKESERGGAFDVR